MSEALGCLIGFGTFIVWALFGGNGGSSRVRQHRRHWTITWPIYMWPPIISNTKNMC